MTKEDNSVPEELQQVWNVTIVVSLHNYISWQNLFILGPVTQFSNANFLFSIIFASSVIWYTTVADCQLFCRLRSQLD
jgi:hypothetical protein